jgi:hypothetical protein
VKQEEVKREVKEAEKEEEEEEEEEEETAVGSLASLGCVECSAVLGEYVCGEEKKRRSTRGRRSTTRYLRSTQVRGRWNVALSFPTPPLDPQLHCTACATVVGTLSWADQSFSFTNVS